MRTLTAFVGEELQSVDRAACASFHTHYAFVISQLESSLFAARAALPATARHLALVVDELQLDMVVIVSSFDAPA